MNKTLLAFSILAALRCAGAEPQSHFASLDDGLKVHYSVYGQGDPTLVFVHGWASDETVWEWSGA